MPTVTWADGFGRWHAKAQSKALARSAVAAEIWARMPWDSARPTPDLVRLAPGHWVEADPLPPACEYVATDVRMTLAVHKARPLQIGGRAGQQIARY